MARRSRHAPLSVYLNGRLVGHLRKHAGGAIEFQYASEWLAWEHTLPVSYSLPLREDRYTGEPVVAVFENLLPDNDRIRQRVAERLHADGVDAYSLLAAAGRDCVGALQFLPEGMAPGPAGAVEGTRVTDEEIGAMLDRLADIPLGVDEEADFRISIAGAQDKTALLKVDGQWLRPTGTTATTHILKPPIGRTQGNPDLSDSVENEWISLELARAMGLPVAKAEIADFAGRKALVVERFDRLWTDETPRRLLRLPQEDCCQALGLPPTKKYESEDGPGILKILDLLKGSDHPARDRAIFFKAQLVFWLLAAIDGHAKNFSIMLTAGGRFQLAPLYDIMSAEPYVASKQMERRKLKLAMAVGDNRHYAIEEIVPRHLRQTAASAGLAEAEVENIERSVWTEAAKTIADFSSRKRSARHRAIAEPIFAGMRKRVGILEKASIT
jgi:serine/threonine-protein kinase HipA